MSANKPTALGGLLVYIALFGLAPLGIVPAAVLAWLANATFTFLPALHLGVVSWPEMYVFMLLTWLLYVQVARYGLAIQVEKQAQLRIAQEQLKAALAGMRVKRASMARKMEEEE